MATRYRLQISEDDVRQELVRLGLDNLPDNVVQEFRKDLFKLIKDDVRKIKQARKATAVTMETNMTSYLNLPDHLHSEKKKSTLRYVDGEIKTESCDVTISETESGYSGDEGDLASSPEKSCSTSGNSVDEASMQQSSLKDPNLLSPPLGSSHGSSESVTVEPSKPNKPLMPSKKTHSVSSKGLLPSYPTRPDPVNLYHYYRAHWDAFKLPGEDPRSNLRWEVRTRLFHSQ